MGYKETQRLENARNACKRTCSCGCTSVLPIGTKNNKDYVVCRWCGKRVYRDEAKQLEHNKKVEKENFRIQMWNMLKSV